MRETYQTKEVSEKFSISIRTLHYYDQQGLLTPSKSSNNYRTYTDKDLRQLQQILYFKELGFKLATIKSIVTKSNFDSQAAFSAQKKLLLKKQSEINKAIAKITDIINSKQYNPMHYNNKTTVTADDVEKFKQLYQEEVDKKYGDSDTYQQYKNKKYSNQQLADMATTGNKVLQEFANHMDLQPSDPNIQKLVKKWQQHITDSYYECTNEILAGLGKMYIEDKRFRDNIDNIKPGLAKFLNKAIAYYTTNSG